MSEPNADHLAQLKVDSNAVNLENYHTVLCKCAVCAALNPSSEENQHPIDVEENRPQRSSDPKDWPEDFDHENGNYLCRCHVCTLSFRGHKRRVRCKVCSQPLAPSSDPTGEAATPRTSALVEQLKWQYSGAAIEVLYKCADFARILERETIALTAEVSRLTAVYEKEFASVQELSAAVASHTQADQLNRINMEAGKQELAAVKAQLAEAHSKGVSFGKKEALSYTLEERERYAKWATQGEEYLKIKDERDEARRQIAGLQGNVKFWEARAEQYRDALAAQSAKEGL